MYSFDSQTNVSANTVNFDFYECNSNSNEFENHSFTSKNGKDSIVSQFVCENGWAIGFGGGR